MEMVLVALIGRKRRRMAALVLATTLLVKARPNLLYSDFLGLLAFVASLTVLALVFFDERQPQPQGLFLSAIIITSLLSMRLLGKWHLYSKANGIRSTQYAVRS